MISVTSPAHITHKFDKKEYLIERMSGYCDGVHVKEKMNQLIDAHNRLVAFVGNTVVLKRELWWRNEATPSTTMVHVPPNKREKMSDQDIRNLVHVLKHWGFYCHCFIPTRKLHGPIEVCVQCNRPTLSEYDLEHD
jgi:hypothetical protein